MCHINAISSRHLEVFLISFFTQWGGREKGWNLSSSVHNTLLFLPKNWWHTHVFNISLVWNAGSESISCLLNSKFRNGILILAFIYTERIINPTFLRRLETPLSMIQDALISESLGLHIIPSLFHRLVFCHWTLIQTITLVQQWPRDFQ